MATGVLDALAERMPFRVRAISVDGGSEFMAEFEVACQVRGIRLFVLPPRSPKLHGSVERANRTHTEEFYEVTDVDLQPDAVRGALLDWSGPTTPSVRTRRSAISLPPSTWRPSESMCTGRAEPVHRVDDTPPTPLSFDGAVIAMCQH